MPRAVVGAFDDGILEAAVFQTADDAPRGFV